MGRHEPGLGRHRVRTIAVAVSAVVVLGLGTWAGVSAATSPDTCEQTDVVRIAAAPEVAAVVDRVANGVAAGQCFSFTVENRDPAAVASSLAVADGTRKPDIWIPDSTLRLRRTKAVGAADVPDSGTSIASSPVVFATTESIARSLGWPAKQPTWQELLATGVNAGLPDPGTDPIGMSALLGFASAASGSPNAGTQLAAAMRRMSDNTLPGANDLYARLPSAGSSKNPVSAFPASESSVLSYNERDGVTASPNRLVALYSPKPVPSLDYPFAVLASAGAPQQNAAAKLLRALQEPQGQAALATAGLRTPDGRMLSGADTGGFVSHLTQPLGALPAEPVLDDLLNQWAKVNTSSRVQVLIDISSSMNEIVPGSGGRSRIDLTTDAASRALSLFKANSEISTWVFSTKLDGANDWREVLPMAPVGQEIAAGAEQQLRAIKATPDGETGLFDSVLAAYQQSSRQWEAGRLNLVIVMTDGRNLDPGGITRDQLVGQLKAMQDPHRPLPVIGIGIGPDIDGGELDAITKVTGGRTFVAPDATHIADVFYGALAGLSCPAAGCS